jgi:hypothetical protein
MMNTLGEEWHNHGIGARTAYAMVTTPQKALVEFHADCNHEQIDELLAGMFRTAEILKITVRFMDLAIMRMHLSKNKLR